MVQIRHAAITGCSSGIGKATAVMLRDKGWTVIPTARNEEDLEELRSSGFEPVRLEIADSQSVQDAATRILEICDGKLGGLVNNAGYGQPGAIEDLSRESIRKQFEVNVIGMQELTNRFIPVFRGQGYGRIVNVSSVLGRIVMPFNGIYCASKFAMEAISDALRTELNDSGIAVSLVEPGPIRSAFKKNATAVASRTLNSVTGHYGELYRQALSQPLQAPRKFWTAALSSEAVALKIVHALESSRPRRRYRVTILAHAGEFIHRFCPDALADWVRFRSARNKFAMLKKQQQATEPG
jgi:short-subunit dehydrogenase